MDAEPIFVFLRVAVALAAVLGLIWFLGRRFAKRGLSGSGQTVKVLARQGLGSKAAVVVVEIESQRYVLGVTDHTVSRLDTLPAQEATDDEPHAENHDDDARNGVSNGFHRGTVSDVDTAETRPTADFEDHLQTAQLRSGRAPAGTIFQPSTWRQAAVALKNRRGA